MLPKYYEFLLSKRMDYKLAWKNNHFLIEKNKKYVQIFNITSLIKFFTDLKGKNTSHLLDKI